MIANGYIIRNSQERGHGTAVEVYRLACNDQNLPMVCDTKGEPGDVMILEVRERPEVQVFLADELAEHGVWKRSVVGIVSYTALSPEVIQDCLDRGIRVLSVVGLRDNAMKALRSVLHSPAIREVYVAMDRTRYAILHTKEVLAALEQNAQAGGCQLSALAEELGRARAKFPSNQYLFHALAEEIGEMADEYIKNGDSQDFRQEARQVACVAERIASEGVNVEGGDTEILEVLAGLEQIARKFWERKKKDRPDLGARSIVQCEAQSKAESSGDPYETARAWVECHTIPTGWGWRRIAWPEGYGYLTHQHSRYTTAGYGITPTDRDASDWVLIPLSKDTEETYQRGTEGVCSDGVPAHHPASNPQTKEEPSTFNYARALFHLGQGLRVRRQSWPSGDYAALDTGSRLLYYNSRENTVDECLPELGDRLASDWEKFEEPVVEAEAKGLSLPEAVRRSGLTGVAFRRTGWTSGCKARVNRQDGTMQFFKRADEFPEAYAPTVHEMTAMDWEMAE